MTVVITEKELVDYLALFEQNPDKPVRFLMVEIGHLRDSIDSLWKVARAARRWQRASPGRESALAEDELMNYLDELKPHDRLED